MVPINSQAISFNTSYTTHTQHISIIPDARYEADEAFQVTLEAQGNDSDIVVSAPSSTIIIVNDDSKPQL